jgi:hypothetical protein
MVVFSMSNAEQKPKTISLGARLTKAATPEPEIDIQMAGFFALVEGLVTAVLDRDPKELAKDSSTLYAYAQSIKNVMDMKS